MSESTQAYLDNQVLHEALATEPTGELTPTEVEVYRKLRRALDDRQFEPGDRIPPERDLAEAYGASRHILRRAILRLVNERRLTRHAGRGTVVTESQKAPIELPPSKLSVGPVDVLEARLAIEPGFVDLLVSRSGEADFERLEAVLVQLERASNQQDFREAGYAFHLELAKCTRNPLLVQIFELIISARAAAGWGRLRGLNDTADARRAQAQSNREILTALRERDAESARRLLRGHLANMLSVVVFQHED